MELRILGFLGCILALLSCEKEIAVEIPVAPSQIVVEGQIELDGFPFVILSRSQPFFDPVNLDDVSKTIIGDANVLVVVNQQDSVSLFPICTGDLSDSLRSIFAAATGLAVVENPQANFCVYTSFDECVRGKSARTYHLIANVQEEQVTAVTSIPPAISLDSLWYKKDGSRDTLGFVWAKLSDPAGKYNAYRWYAQRINQYTFGEDLGTQKDPFFIAPFGSVFEDEFFDGLTFDIAFNRGTVPGSNKLDDNSIESGYFKVGDTIGVKFTTIDKGVFEYYRSFYTAVGNTGSPFATPSNVKTNVEGGLGVWAGYGVYIDTLVAKDLQ